jgi:uncharacterized lipoprotein YddW (UPF0748 family)
MKNVLTFLIFLLLPILISAQQNNQEFRATWVITWEYISASSSVEQNKARIRKILDEHKAANMNAVVWQIRQAGTAYYNSSYEPWGSYAGGTYPGFDPLQYALEEAHKRGLEFHAWFNVFASGSTAPGAPASQHPEWICRDRDGNPMTSNIALSPGLEEVRNYLKNVAMEVVRNYDIDGLHFDYVRWNEYSNSNQSKIFGEEKEANNYPDGYITPEQLEEITSNPSGRYLYDVDHPYSGGVPSGYSSWEQWWRATVTEYVKDMHDSIQAVKPWVRLSPAAIGKYNWSGWNGYSIVYQDAALWFNEGYIDQIMGMHYHWTTGAGFYDMLQGGCPQCWSQYIQPGINAGRLYTVGPPSYILDDNNIWGRHSEIVASVRTVPWTDGFQFFSYGSWRNRDYWSQAASTFFKQKTKIRATKLIIDSTPDAPSVNIQKIDSLNYQLTITPPVSSSIDQWYALYRSTDNIIDPDTDQIIDIFFGNSAIIVDEVFDGTQDFNGAYKYGVTMFDRYWNESLPSNIAETDPIPSYAPIVTGSTPTDGDTISVNTKIQIEFSKTIDQNSFSIDIVPAVNINSFSWSSDGRTVTVQSDNFDFAADYTLTLPASITDINGLELDGNKDGIGGDEFSLSFSTVEQDLTGPTIISSYPGETDSIDVEAVLSIVFDELVDPVTIIHNNIILKLEDNVLGKDLKLSELGGQSILNIKTSQALNTNSSYSLTLTEGITDVYGNPFASEHVINFVTADQMYSTRTMIDDFTSEGNWWHPSGSGSTTGIVDSGTYFGYSTMISVPASSPPKSSYINYQWDVNASTKLIRAYLSGGAPRDVLFDTSYVLQVYVYGDGSGNRFRFAIDEGDGTAWPNHEVSTWYTIDWIGWKLIEWRLSDPGSIGSWIGNGQLDFPLYRIDSFQMTNFAGSSNYGRIYFDNLRLVKKSTVVSDIAEEINLVPDEFMLYQNYPNPFNPATVIPFSIDKEGLVKLELYDVLGRKISTIIDENLKAGFHEINFDASGLSSGKYFYRIIFDGKQHARMMILLK